DLTVDGTPGRSAKRFEWDGRPQILEFAVAVPANAAARSVMLKFHVRIEGLVIERVLLGLELANGPVGSGERSCGAGRLPATAFASYSSLDRPRVLDRVAAIRIAAGIDVFLDCMDLNPGEQWKPRLEREIDARDLFILFWSAAAARSRWVSWEWEHAFKTKKHAMQIQP